MHAGDMLIDSGFAVVPGFRTVLHINITFTVLNDRHVRSYICHTIVYIFSRYCLSLSQCLLVSVLFEVFYFVLSFLPRDATQSAVLPRQVFRVTGRFAPSSVHPLNVPPRRFAPGRIQRFLLIQLKPKHHRLDVLTTHVTVT